MNYCFRCWLHIAKFTDNLLDTGGVGGVGCIVVVVFVLVWPWNN